MVITKGERIAAFRNRIRRRVREIARANRGKTVLIMTHGGAITALLSDWMKADFDTLLLNLQIDNTSLTFVEATDTRVYLNVINDTEHLSWKEKHERHRHHRKHS